MKFLCFDLIQGASISPGEQTDATACFWLPGVKLTNETEQNLFVAIPMETVSPVSGGPIETLHVCVSNRNRMFSLL